MTENQILNDLYQIDDDKKLVAILELTVSKLDIDTISEMARKEGKYPNGIRKSNCYRKIKIGKKTLVVKEFRNVKLPF